MTEQEKQDLEVFKMNIQAEKLRLYDYLRYLDHMNDKELADCGYRNGNADAMRKAFQDSQRNIAKLSKDFLSKHPD